MSQLFYYALQEILLVVLRTIRSDLGLQTPLGLRHAVLRRCFALTRRSKCSWTSTRKLMTRCKGLLPLAGEHGWTWFEHGWTWLNMDGVDQELMSWRLKPKRLRSSQNWYLSCNSRRQELRGSLWIEESDGQKKPRCHDGSRNGQDGAQQLWSMNHRTSWFGIDQELLWHALARIPSQYRNRHKLEASCRSTGSLALIP